MVLSTKHKDQLHKAMLDYLRAKGYSNTYQTFKEEAKLEDPDASSQGLLEKKWTAVIRLQKKILDLEAKIKQIEQDGPSSLDPSGAPTDPLPRPPERFVLTGHRNNLNAVRFHPIYSVLATASEDTTIKVWDYESGELERTLKGHTLAVTDIAFSSSSTASLLASCSNDLTVKLWDFRPGQESTSGATQSAMKTLHGHDHSVSGVAWHPSGDYVVSCSRDRTLRIWQVATGYCVRTVYDAGDDWIKKISFGAEGVLLASCGHDRNVRIWQWERLLKEGSGVAVVKAGGGGSKTGGSGSTGAANGKDDDEEGSEVSITLRGHEHVVECVDWSSVPVRKRKARGRQATAQTQGTEPVTWRLATGGRDKKVKVWEVTLKESSAGGGKKEMIGVEVIELGAHENWVRGVKWSADGRWLVSVGEDKTIRVWDMRDETTTSVAKSSPSVTRTMSGSEANGKQNEEGEGTAEEEEESGGRFGRCVKTIYDAHAHFVSCVDWKGGKKRSRLATGGVDDVAKIWECK